VRQRLVLLSLASPYSISAAFWRSPCDQTAVLCHICRVHIETRANTYPSITAHPSWCLVHHVLRDGRKPLNIDCGDSVESFHSLQKPPVAGRIHPAACPILSFQCSSSCAGAPNYSTLLRTGSWVINFSSLCSGYSSCVGIAGSSKPAYPITIDRKMKPSPRAWKWCTSPSRWDRHPRIRCSFRMMSVLNRNPMHRFQN